MEKINITTDGLEFVNDAGRKVVLRTNHGATSDQYLDLPALAGTITTNTTSTDTDEKTKVSSNDTTAGYLNGKLVAGSGITLTENNNGSNETLTIAASGGGGSYAEYYDVTLADCENTADLVDVMKITVPANTWADGQMIVFDFAFQAQNYSGVTRYPYIGFNGTTITGVDCTGYWTSSSSFYRGYFRVMAMRVGNSCFVLGDWLNDSGYTLVNSTFGDLSTAVDRGWLSGQYGAYNLDQDVDYTNNIDLRIQYQWGGASPSTYFRPMFGSAYKSGKGASS